MVLDITADLQLIRIQCCIGLISACKYQRDPYYLQRELVKVQHYVSLFSEGQSFQTFLKCIQQVSSFVNCCISLHLTDKRKLIGSVKISCASVCSYHTTSDHFQVTLWLSSSKNTLHEFLARKLV